MKTSTDRIEKTVEINAPRSKVWEALTDHRKFGAWFEASMNDPFVVGQTSHGTAMCGEHGEVSMELHIKSIEPEHAFSFTWLPYSPGTELEDADLVHTLVEFRLEETESGTRLYVTESGFEKVSELRRDEAFRMNTMGWEMQCENIKTYAEKP